MKVRTVEMDSEDTFSRIKPSDYRENWPPYTLELENAYIGPGGAIYNTNGLLNPLACFTYGFWGNLNQDSARPNNSLEAQAWAKKQPAINPSNFTIETLDVGRNYVYAHHYFNIYVFGHLWDTLQDLGKIEGLNLEHKTLITPSVTGHVNDLDIHLQAFGFPLEKRVSLDLPAHKPCNLLYKVPRLYYPSPTAYPSQVSKGGLKYLRSKYLPLVQEAFNPTKLYLQRPTGKARTVINEKKVLKKLKREGYTILNGTEGLLAHIKLFRHATTIIGAHGSLFRNMIFCENKPTVYEFCPHNREDHNFEGIGKTMGLNYNWINTPADNDHNISIDLQNII